MGVVETDSSVVMDSVMTVSYVVLSPFESIMGMVVSDTTRTTEITKTEEKTTAIILLLILFFLLPVQVKVPEGALCSTYKSVFCQRNIPRKGDLRDEMLLTSISKVSLPRFLSIGVLLSLSSSAFDEGPRRGGRGLEN